jgi:Mrp family chromosome partitioning ATPase
VVAVGDPRVAGLAVASLAVACAREGKRVVVADLCAGGPAARLLGAGSGSGVRPVSAEGAYLLVVTPERDDVVPVGPLGGGRVQARPAVAGDALAAAWESADLLLTVVSLDPALGGEHLASWCGGAVVVVTAGESTATRVHAVGEMVRLSGVPLVSGVLIGADKTDESLGVLPPPSRQPEQVQPAAAVEPAVAGAASR